MQTFAWIEQERRGTFSYRDTAQQKLEKSDRNNIAAETSGLCYRKGLCDTCPCATSYSGGEPRDDVLTVKFEGCGLQDNLADIDEFRNVQKPSALKPVTWSWKMATVHTRLRLPCSNCRSIIVPSYLIKGFMQSLLRLYADMTRTGYYCIHRHKLSHRKQRTPSYPRPGNQPPFPTLSLTRELKWEIRYGLLTGQYSRSISTPSASIDDDLVPHPGNGKDPRSISQSTQGRYLVTVILARECTCKIRASRQLG